MAWDDDNSGPMPPPTGKPNPRRRPGEPIPDYKDPPVPRPTLQQLKGQTDTRKECPTCGCKDKRKIRFNLALLLLPPDSVHNMPRGEWRCRNCGRPVDPPRTSG